MISRYLVRLSIGLYQKLLFCYPIDFRRAYGDEMRQVFATQCRQTTNLGELLRCWLLTLRDLVITALVERLMTEDHNRRTSTMTGVLFGLAAGILGSVNAVTSPALIGEAAEKVIAYVVLFGVLALAFAAGLTAARLSKRVVTGLWVGLLVGVMTSLIANTARVGYSIAFYDFVRHDPGEIHDWMRRGGGSFVQYLIDDRIGGYLYMTLFVGVGCALFGVVGGWINKLRFAELWHV